MPVIWHPHLPISRRRVLGRAGTVMLALGGGAGIGSRSSAATQGTALASQATAGPARLASMLRLAPAEVSGEILFSWADLATQYEAIGFPQPESADDLGMDFVQVTQGMALPTDIFQYARLNYDEVFGFQPAHIEQALQVGIPPEQLTLLRGRFSEPQLRRVWEANDYKPLDHELGTIWSFAAEPEIDVATDVGRFGLGRMNNATILADGTVVFAPTLDLVETVLAVVVGDERSLVARDDVAVQGQTLPPGLVSAIGVTTDALAFESPNLTPEVREEIEARRAEQEDAVGAMPAVELALLGITAGLHRPAGDEEPTPLPVDADAPAPTVVVRLLTESEEAAAQAADVVAHRWDEWSSLATGEPLSTLLELERAEACEEAPVAAFDFVLPEERSAAVWRQMVSVGDVAAFGP